MIKALNFQLTVGGTDLTDYVVSMEREHSLCSPLASLSVELAPNLPIAIAPYQTVTFYEDGIKTFTGYSQENIAARLPVEVSMRCADVLIRAQDTWFTGPLVANGESAEAWIRNFLKRAGIKKVVTEVFENYSIYPGYGWEYTTCWDAITTCMQQSPYMVFADRHGVVHIKQTKRSPVDYTINEYTDYERLTSDSWIRNRAVVYGNGFVSDRREANAHLLPGEVRAAIVATGQIHWESTANAIVGRMLNEFRDPLDVKVVEIEGSPNYEITQIVDFTDPETGYHRADCMITGISTSMSAEDGYITELTLDEKCISFWGWDSEPIPPPPHLYTGMSDSGVYRAEWEYTLPLVWTAYNNGLSGSALTVYDIKIRNLNNTIWLATAGGLYKKGNNTWIKIPLPLTTEDLSVTPVSIWLSEVGYGITCVLVVDTNGTAWIYRTVNNCQTWIMLKVTGGEVYNFDDDAEGWTWLSMFADMTGTYDAVHGHDAPGCLKADTTNANSGGGWSKIGPGWIIAGGDSIRAWLYLDGITQVRFVFWYTDATASFSTWKNTPGWSQKSYSVPAGDIGKTVSAVEVQFGNTPYGGPPAEYGYVDDIEFLRGAYTPYTAGRTHILDSDDTYIYITGEGGGGRPVVLRIPNSLDEVESILAPASGAWAGVRCDYDRIWVFGDLGTFLLADVKVKYSDDFGDTWTDVTDAAWNANEVVRSIIPTFSPNADYFAILSVAEEIWKTDDPDVGWDKLADLNLPANFGTELYSGGIFIGDEGADANILQYGKSSGTSWTEESGGIPVGKRMANVIEEIEFV